MNLLIQRYRETRAELEKQLHQNELFLAWKQVSDDIARAEATLPGQDNPASIGHQVVQRQPVGSADFLVEYLEKTGHPIPTRKVMSLYEATYGPIKNEGSFRSNLSKDERLTSVQTGPSKRTDCLWWIVGRPLPDGITRWASEKNSASPELSSGEAVNGSGSL